MKTLGQVLSGGTTAAACLLGLAGCVPPKPTPAAAFLSSPAFMPVFAIRKSAPSGQRQAINFDADVKPDCSSAALFSFNIERPPAHGSVDFQAVDDFPTFPPASPRAKCNEQKVSGWQTLYTSQPGFVGEDNFTISTITPEGWRFIEHYMVTVGPLGPNFHPLEQL